MDISFWLWVVWSVLFGALAVVILVAAFKRKGRVAFLMLPLVLWIFSRPLLIFIHYSVQAAILDSDSSLHSDQHDRLQTAGLIFRLIVMMGTTTWFLPLILIFKKDKPKPEESPTPS
jgi:hypothetical protein